jgi:hypothetical protein
LLKWRLRFATAEVGQSPSCIPQHRQFGSIRKLRQQRYQSTMTKYKIPAFWGVTSDISQSPNSLLTDIITGGTEQLNKDWYCSWGKSARRRKPTNWGTTSAAITSSIGGLRSARQIHKMAQQCMHHNLKTCDSYINIQKEQ